MAHAIVNKLLHEPTSRLRRAAELGVEAELADAVARLFGLAEEHLEGSGANGHRSDCEPDHDLDRDGNLDADRARDAGPNLTDPKP